MIGGPHVVFEVEYPGTAGSKKIESTPVQSITIALTLDTSIDFAISSRLNLIITTLEKNLRIFNKY